MRYGDCTAPKMHYVYSVNFSIQVLKNHLRLIRGSTILDHTGADFSGGRLIRGSDLYASIYGMFCNTCDVLMLYKHVPMINTNRTAVKPVLCQRD